MYTKIVFLKIETVNLWDKRQTFSSEGSDLPISFKLNWQQAIVPSKEHANTYCPHFVLKKKHHLKSLLLYCRLIINAIQEGDTKRLFL